APDPSERGTRTRNRLLAVVLLGAATAIVVGTQSVGAGRPQRAEIDFRAPTRTHLDHTPFFNAPFSSPDAVTTACLECHPEAATEVMGTSHWQWLGEEVRIPGHPEPQRIGKKNLLNNFCISITGNFASCTKCHVGYGWQDDRFDFTDETKVDCLVCHDHSGTYLKGSAGMPAPEVDLLAAAQSVGVPQRENCTVCHAYGGGGQAVKHGDLDSSLENPSAHDDLHMGRDGFLCIDCHRTEHHEIRGRAFSVSVENANGIHCTDCHRQPPHADPRLNAHLSAVACEACHIPTFSRKLPSKSYWDWSKAGDPTRPEDPHEYLKIKGEFVYEHDVVPEYRWFNETMDRYLLGDTIDPDGITPINRPLGDIHDPTAKITPFKVHRARQPYDTQLLTLLPPLTAGEGGFWHDFDWDQALRRGAEASAVSYSGQYGWAVTEMFWPISHMVTPKEDALDCTGCHGAEGRLDWTALGYPGDPIRVGGRR
ncbi:MAG: tetrathionate reductase family octaheme c-type cytochrome, partial [Candidatus Eisenbacteria bacterium]|nr:tetrathionate reductase family octaheme c-type cytochrome [Candidatus Eisenbacteria bacterium]